MGDLTISGFDLESLTVKNLAVAKNVMIQDTSIKTSNVFLGLGGELGVVKSMFVDSTVKIAGSLVRLHSCTVKGCTWEAPDGWPVSLCLKGGP